jgi:hypothetical protein
VLAAKYVVTARRSTASPTTSRNEEELVEFLVIRGCPELGISESTIVTSAPNPTTFVERLEPMKPSRP